MSPEILSFKNGIVIRQAEPCDAKAILTLVGQVFHEYGMIFAPESWDTDLLHPHIHYAMPNAMFFVAQEPGGRLIGTAGGHIEPDKMTPELHRLYLDFSFRGQGLGSHLCSLVENWARQKGISRMVLWSDIRFLHAHFLYRNLGYQIFGSRILNDPDRSVEFGMARDITKPQAHAADPIMPELRKSITCILIEEARSNPQLWHKARCAAAALSDVRERLNPASPKDSPMASRYLSPTGESGIFAQVFDKKSEIPVPGIQILVAGGDTVIGFREILSSRLVNPSERWMHPSCR